MKASLVFKSHDTRLPMTGRDQCVLSKPTFPLYIPRSYPAIGELFTGEFNPLRYLTKTLNLKNPIL